MPIELPGQVDLWLVYLGSIAGLVGVLELGHWLGSRAQTLGSDPGGSVTSTLQSGTLGLLALMIGFTYSLAVVRFEARRQALTEEANAIGTTALRAQLLPESHAAVVAGLLRSYVAARIVPAADVDESDILEQRIKASVDLQNQLWQHAVAVSAEHPHSIPIGLFVQALNEMIDQHTLRLGAIRNHVPFMVFALLYLIAAVAMGFTGYEAGLLGRRKLLPPIITTIMVATVIALIIDIDQPRHGFLTISQRPLLELQQSLAVPPGR